MKNGSLGTLMHNRLGIKFIAMTLGATVMFCDSKQVRDGSQNVVYWTAPSVELSRFEKKIVEEWNASHPEAQITWNTIPAGVTSEEVILTAIATRTGPDISSNIFGGFAAQLADAGVIIALDTLPGFWDLMEKRKMANIIRDDWFYKGHVYIIPVYVSPQLMWYNQSILDKYGITELPRTYSEFFTLLEKVYIPKEVYGLTVDISSKWFERWFDYLALYIAASGGEPYLDAIESEAFFDNKAGLAVTEFISQIFEKGYAPRFAIQDGFEKGLFLASIKDAGKIVRTSIMYPDLEYVIGPLLVPDYYPMNAPVYTLAESKGIALFSTSQNTQKAWDFITWYFSDRHDSLWLEITNYLPAREDLTTNPIFSDYFSDNPDMKTYAVAFDQSVPLVMTPQTVEVQTLLNRELWQPIIFGLKSPLKASKDANLAIQRILKSGP